MPSSACLVTTLLCSKVLEDPKMFRPILKKLGSGTSLCTQCAGYYLLRIDPNNNVGHKKMLTHVMEL